MLVREGLEITDSLASGRLTCTERQVGAGAQEIAKRSPASGTRIDWKS